jgi:hypothetical protein
LNNIILGIKPAVIGKNKDITSIVYSRFAPLKCFLAIGNAIIVAIIHMPKGVKKARIMLFLKLFNISALSHATAKLSRVGFIVRAVGLLRKSSVLLRDTFNTEKSGTIENRHIRIKNICTAIFALLFFLIVLPPSFLKIFGQ